MDINISSTYLSVDDPKAAFDFYRDVLGFEVRSDVGKGDMRWITVGPASQPEISIVLGPPGANASEDDQRLMTELMAKGVLGLVIFTTPDVDATFEKLLAAGADVVQEPIDQPWGPRDCAVRDPAGNMLRFNQA